MVRERSLRNRLSYRRRASLTLTQTERVEMRELRVLIMSLANIIRSADEYDYICSDKLEKLEASLLRSIEFYDSITNVPLSLNTRLPEIRNKKRTIDSFSSDDVAEYFRFKDHSQLHELMRCFQIPDFIHAHNSRHKFKGEEALLILLYRLHRPTSVTDDCFRELFGYEYTRVSRASTAMVYFFMSNWSYLLEDNMQFWKPYLPSFATAIRDHLDAGKVFLGRAKAKGSGQRVFGFLDNTIVPTSRLGYGPVSEGEGTSRICPMLQRAFCSGWENLHGLKWQTVDLPNGMFFNIWGPVSCSHSDLNTLSDSNLISSLELLQEDKPIKYCVYGDSAYTDVPNKLYVQSPIKSSGDGSLKSRYVSINNGMSNARNLIEWNYGVNGDLWKISTFKRGGKLRVQRVCAVVITCFLMMNAHVCLNGCSASEHFKLIPPDLYEWTIRGRRERLISDNEDIDEDVL